MPVVLAIPENHKMKIVNMRILLVFFMLGTLAMSCRSTRKITQVVTKDSTAILVPPTADDSVRLVEETFAQIKRNNIDFNTFSAKVKVDYRDSKERKYDFNTFMRIRKDSTIWVSIIAALGIEAFRVVITPDSIKILDKLEKTYDMKPLSYLQEITKLPFDFKTLQDIIIGNPVYTEGDVTSIKQSDEMITMSLAGDFFKHLMTFRKSDYILLTSKLDDIDKSKNRTANLAYEDHSSDGTIRFSNRRKINIAEKTNLDVDLEFKQVEFNKQLSYPFSIPRNYKMK